MVRTALIVDDCHISCMITGRILAAAGYRVVEANDGNAALNTLSGLHVDLVVSDLNMPGMNGIDLIRAIRRMPELSNIPMFILSSATSEEMRQDGFAAGATAWLQKPLEPQQMLKLIR